MNDQATLPAKSGPAGFALPPLTRLRDEIDRLFDDFSFARPARSIFAFPTVAEFNPAMQLADKKSHYELSVELPGMDQNDIDVEVIDGVLTISGEKRVESETEEDGYLMKERRYGSFRRQLSLPSDADPAGIDARYRNGVLNLSIKKDQKAASRARKIKIG